MAIDTILLAVGSGDGDRTDRLVTETAAVAGPADARVVVLHAFSEEQFSDTVDRLDFDSDREAVTPRMVARRLVPVRDVTGAFDDAAVDYDVRGAVGDPAEMINETAEGVGADRVIVAGRNRSPTGKAVFGSTAQAVMLGAPCPVTFVRTDADD
jgi:nucleotide-binding universal stress UspA family protein